MCPNSASACRIADSNSSVQIFSKALLDEDEESSFFHSNVPLSICVFPSPVEEKLWSRLEKCLDFLARSLPVFSTKINQFTLLSPCFLYSLYV